MRNIEELRNYFLGKDPQLKETCADNSLRLIGIPGREFVLKAELYKRLKILTDALQAEQEARIAEDEKLQGNIDTEARIRSEADEELGRGLAQEIQDRKDSDNLLAGDIDALDRTVDAIIDWANTADFVYVNDLESRLLNYYTKAQVDALLEIIPRFSIEIVEELPTQDISTTTIYMLAKEDGSGNDYYDEYIYVDNEWELIGSTQVDLTNYYTKDEANAQFAPNSEVHFIESMLQLVDDKTSSVRGGLFTTTPDVLSDSYTAAYYDCGTIEFSVLKDDMIKVTGKGSTNARLWALYDTNGDIIDKAEADEVLEDIELQAPSDGTAILNFFEKTTYPYEVVLTRYKTMEDVESDLSGKVSKSGDTMSGNLTNTASVTIGARAQGSTVGARSLVVGTLNVASGARSVAEGQGTTATANNAHAEGTYSVASGTNAHAEGYQTMASGNSSHAEGADNFSTGRAAHTEGGSPSSTTEKTLLIYGLANVTTYDCYDTTNATIGAYFKSSEAVAKVVSVVEDEYVTFDRTLSTTSILDEGEEVEMVYGNVATGECSHAEGCSSVASGAVSHAEGFNTTAQRRSQHVEGEYNVLDTTGADVDAKGDYIHIAGNGTSISNQSNAHTLDWSGNAWFAGDVYVGSTSGTHKDAGSKKLATEDTFTGTDGLVAGAKGLVPAPATADDGKFLCADGTWAAAGGGITALTSPVTLWELTEGVYSTTGVTNFKYNYDYPTSTFQTSQPGLVVVHEESQYENKYAIYAGGLIITGKTDTLLGDNVFIAKNAEATQNKVTSLSAGSTDIQYPSAKCVYDAIPKITYGTQDLTPGISPLAEGTFYFVYE